MDKDFLNKKISLKDIDLKKINFKNIKNKKEIVIGILVLIFVIAVLVIGSVLLNKRADAKSEYEKKESRYNSLQNALSEESIRNNISKLEMEKEGLADIVTSITPAQFNDVFNEFKKGVAIYWDKSDGNEEISLKTDNKDYPEYDIYSVNIKTFSGTLSEIKDFLEYVDGYSKIVRVDTITFKQNQITGRLSGQVRLSFYFKKLSE